MGTGDTKGNRDVDPARSQEAEAAFRRVEAELRAFLPDELHTLGLDREHAIETALASAQRLQRYHPRMIAMPGFDARSVDNLADYALALRHLLATHGDAPQRRAARAPNHFHEACALRLRLLKAGAQLAAVRVMDMLLVGKGIRGRPGRAEIAADLREIVEAFQKRWDVPVVRNSVTSQELERALELSYALVDPDTLAALQREATISPDLVRAAWTRLEHAYEDCTRVINYLCQEEGEAERVLPPLRPRRLLN
jgi:hypothetical protein